MDFVLVPYLIEILIFCRITFRAFSLDEIPARTKQGAAIIHMILNNLDKAVAQFPQELITYGGNGQVFSNWAQVSRLKICYLTT